MARSKKDEPEFYLDEITPDLAQEFLSKNTNVNRTLTQAHVDKLAAEMDAGEWKVTHEAIAFDKQGNLIDGQHRLAAIIKHGKPVLMMIADKCDPETFTKIGYGRARNSTDVFTIFFKKRFGDAPARGTYITSIAAAMLTRLGAAYPGREDIAEHAIKHYKLITRVMDTLYGRGNAKTTKAIFGTPILGAFANASLYFGEARITPLMERVGDQMWTGQQDPLKILSDKLLRAKMGEARDRRARLSKTEKYAVAIAAIRNALSGQSRQRIEPTTQDVGEAEMDRRIRRGQPVDAAEGDAEEAVA